MVQVKRSTEGKSTRNAAMCSKKMDSKRHGTKEEATTITSNIEFIDAQKSVALYQYPHALNGIKKKDIMKW